MQGEGFLGCLSVVEREVKLLLLLAMANLRVSRTIEILFQNRAPFCMPSDSVLQFCQWVDSPCYDAPRVSGCGCMHVAAVLPEPQAV